MTPNDVTPQHLIDFVVHEARLLDEKRFDDWNALFAEDAWYWVPLTPEQPDALNHTSHIYADKLLRDVRIQRLKNRRVFSQKPPSRSQHVLQTPYVDEMDAADNKFVLRTPFHYAEYQSGHATEYQAEEIHILVGVAWHTLTVADDALRISLKRVDIINSDAALPGIQLFV